MANDVNFPTNSEWAVKSENLHREYFSSTISRLGFCLLAGVGFNDVLKDFNPRPGAYHERARLLVTKTPLLTLRCL